MTACGATIRDKSAEYKYMSIVLGTATIGLVVVRLVFKYFFSAARELGIDDKIIMGTLALRITCTVLDVQGLAANGLGRDAWTLPTHEVMNFLEYLYVMVALYLAELSLIKLSLLFFYLYIFPGRTVRRLLIGTIVFDALSGCSFVIASIFACSPVSHYWTQLLGSSGTCININAFGWSNASISVALDLWMICIPLYQIQKLQLHWKKKIGVTIMFLLGAL